MAPMFTQPNIQKRKTFSKDEITSIFGKQVHPAKGNRILHLVQEQRIAGTIDDGIPAPHEQKEVALAWLRNHYPVNEEQAILNRLEREEEAAFQSQRQQGGNIYGNPVIDQIRRHNLARQAEKDAEKAKAEAEGKSDPPVSTSRAIAEREERRAKNLIWVEKYEKKAQEAGLKSVPQMSFIRRAGPAILTTVAVVSFCIMFAQNYTPPPRAARLFPEIPLATATVGVLIGMNVAVWLAWKWPPIWRFMNRVFLLVPAYPYASSLLGNNFSHQLWSHLAANMTALWVIEEESAFGHCHQQRRRQYSHYFYSLYSLF
ncbi:MAG: hypothetical protein Q9166_000461 [cf. Caloplaca sp. 2 TL-2023]